MQLDRIITILLLTVLFSKPTFAQDRTPILIGFQPGVTKEKFYKENEFDINVFPLVVEIPISKRLDLRFVSILNYHFGPANQISDIGGQLIAPVFFKKKEIIKEPSYGFYLGPLYGYGRNILNNHQTHTIGGEVGYQIEAGNSFTVTVGLQLGGSYFNYNEGPSSWRNHFGIKVNLAWWLTRSSN